MAHKAINACLPYSTRTHTLVGRESVDSLTAMLRYTRAHDRPRGDRENTHSGQNVIHSPCFQSFGMLPWNGPSDRCAPSQLRPVHMQSFHKTTDVGNDSPKLNLSLCCLFPAQVRSAGRFRSVKCGMRISSILIGDPYCASCMSERRSSCSSWREKTR
jgi:hypothetical protein